MNKNIMAVLSALFSLYGLAQEAPSKGFLLPRLTTSERNAMVNPAKGIMIFNTTTNSQQINVGTSSSPDWSTNTISTIESSQLLTDAPTITWNTSLGYNAAVTLTGSRTIDVTNATAGGYGTIVVKQDATGNRTLVLPTNSKIRSGGGVCNIPILTPDANAVDILSFYYDGTTYWWVVGNNFN